jgi:hypothetical protein
MQFEMGDLVRHTVWQQHVYAITGFNQRDPKMPDWCNDSVRIELLFSKEGYQQMGDSIRYITRRIFESEFEALKDCDL